MGGKGSLLIVDDERSVRDSLSRWFADAGYEVGAAESAAEALTRLAERKWDIALVDIKMPDTDGIELQRKLKEADPDLTVIIMTGYASLETAVEALKPCAAGSRTLADVQRAHILQVMEQCGGNQTRAAGVLDIDRVTLHNKLKRYGWSKPTVEK